MDLLSLGTFKLNAYENIIPSDDILNKIVEDCNLNENFLFNFSTKYDIIFNENQSYKNRIDYFSTLIHLLLEKIDSFYYTEDDILLYIYYNALVVNRIYQVDDLNEVIELLEKNVLELVPSTNVEIFIKEKLKYLLLEYYISQISINNNNLKMKELLIDLKDNKNKFDELQEEYGVR